MSSSRATVLDQLDDAARTTGTVSFGRSRDTFTVAELWLRSERAADWFSARCDAGESIGMVLGTSPGSLVALMGAWRSGLAVLSLPDPSRLGPATFRALSHRVAGSSGATVAVGERAAVDALSDAWPSAFATDELTGAPVGRREGCGSFVQYTSGSTRNPAGVHLDLAAVARGLDAIQERVAESSSHMDGQVRTVSWLPLSHDMGLFGGCLASMVGARRTGSGTATWLLDPLEFMRRPTMWLSACSDFDASVTVSSVSALSLATRVATRHNDRLDLGGVEMLLVGGELAQPAAIDSFVDAHAPFGLGAGVVRPSYGLAENTLAVTIAGPDSARRSLGDHLSVVSCGRAVAGTEVAIDRPDADGVGEVAIRGASLFGGYLGDRERRMRDGWFLTGDRGFIHDRELYPLGRVDDLITVRGQNVVPDDVESAVAAALGRLCTGVVAVADGDSYALIVEIRSGSVADVSVLNDASAAALAQVGLRPHRVVVVARRSLPRTPSGKVQRSKARTLVDGGAVGVLAERSYTATKLNTRPDR